VVSQEKQKAKTQSKAEKTNEQKRNPKQVYVQERLQFLFSEIIVTECKEMKIQLAEQCGRTSMSFVAFNVKCENVLFMSGRVVYGLRGPRLFVPFEATGAAGAPLPSMLPVNSATLALMRATRDSIALERQ
jgi:hypothetical protein